MITIEKVSEFVGDLNLLINQMVLADKNEAEITDMPRTWQLFRAVAMQSHKWISLDGQAIRFTMPIDSDELIQAKKQGLKEIFKDLIREHAREESDGIQLDKMLTSLLSSAPISYLEEEDALTLQLGTRRGAHTLRLDLRENYEPSLEEVVMKAVRSDLDARLAGVLIDGEHLSATSHLQALLTWGPPEVPIRALLNCLDADDEDRRAQAQAILRERAQTWNQAKRTPAAPADDEDPAAYRDAWQTWYRSVSYDR
ncbi:MAG: hypothetical protein ACYTG5_14235 [Planctomycetota bacterium]